MNAMKGLRTVAIGLTMAIGPAAISYLAGVDWAALFGPKVSLAIGGAIMVAMRLITTTPVGKPS